MIDQRKTNAHDLATRLHAGQTDKRGEPYLNHLEAVVANLLRRWPDAPTYAVEAAWLHDALEDTDATLEKLAAAGISPEAILLVMQLTRQPGVEYQRWIEALAEAGSLWAVRVKLAENEHNFDPIRAIPGSDANERRYAPARRVLEAADTGYVTSTR